LSYGHDLQGSVSQLLDDNGNVQASYGYQAYGTPDPELTDEHDPETGQVTDAGNPLPPADPVNSYRWQDKRVDRGSGTLDLGARRYSSGTAHFLQADKYQGALDDLGLEQDTLTQNRYGFAGGNPVSYIDEDGHMPIDMSGAQVRRWARARTAAAAGGSSGGSGGGSSATGRTTTQGTAAHATASRAPRSSTRSPIFSWPDNFSGLCVLSGCQNGKRVVDECVGSNSGRLGCASSAVGHGLDEVSNHAHVRSEQKIAENAHLRRSGTPAESAKAVYGRAPQSARTARTVSKAAGRASKFIGAVGGPLSTAMAINEGENPTRAVTKGVFSEVGGELGAGLAGAACSELGPVAIGCAAGGGAVGSALGSVGGGAVYDAASWALDQAGEAGAPLISPMDTLSGLLG
jgi:RHS repeat-associated protein